LRRIRLLCPLVVALGLVLPAAASARTTWYVALGDSLARGVQPNAAGVSVLTTAGYVDDLYATERTSHPGLRLKKLGCPGETSTSMIKGGSCRYAAGSQLAAARSFLRHHHGRIAFLTLDIGANDVDGCLKNGSIDGTCLTAGLKSAGRNVPKIAKELRAAAGSAPTMVGMTYYDPFLALYVQGATYRTLAVASVSLSGSFNDSLVAGYRKAKFRIADVAKAFRTKAQTSTTVPGLGTVPTNVAQICALTWMCAPAPVGPNIHANAAGYTLIARTFEKRLR
jgi:lysophospholipase L1-like esterase